jgi:hypothetical protein
MALLSHQEQIDNLRMEILFRQGQYDQAIKEGKMLKETKKMFKEIRAMEKKLQFLIENKDQLVKVTN